MANGHASRISIREIFSSIKLLNTVLQLPLRVLYHFFLSFYYGLTFLGDQQAGYSSQCLAR